MQRRKVLITGAAGNIGRHLAPHLEDTYDLRLVDMRASAALSSTPVSHADIADLEAMTAACRGVDTVLHLAAAADPKSTWEDLVPRNIVGTRNVFEAARAAGCRRVVFASSIHAVDGHARGEPLASSIAPRPYNLYGATKAFGEALASAYEKTGGPSAICLRIGWVMEHEPHWRALLAAGPDKDLWLSHRDLFALLRLCIEAPDGLRYGVFNATSNNRHKRLDLGDTQRTLGYRPQDDAFAEIEKPA